ncbi:hypothetical protein [Microbacterium halophytorum]|uniref:hypothetical protein n=1 Tax=Microbacterium halophytorum TaxID=2067568 RepID=UPI001319EC6B|nr:hypothetical protein [Microbacterium halophytorum]
MAPVIELKRHDLEARRSDLLAEVGLNTYEEFVERSRRRAFSDADWAIRDELDSIAYLLGADELTD